MREAAKEPEQKTCEGCHTPLLSRVDPMSPAVLEGVGCDVCHSIADIREESFGVFAEYALHENIKRGFRCGGKDNYFHKAGCSPQFRQSVICAPCHSWAMPKNSGGHLWVFNEYNEWKAGTFNSVPCQDCHMPAIVDEIAVGWEKKALLGHHGMMGDNNTLRMQAIEISGRVDAKGQKLSIALDVKNKGAGHKAPGGLPGRQMILRAVLLDQAGAEAARGERIYERRLVNADGDDVPFFQAEREDKDTRLSPGEARRERFEFEYAQGGQFRIELLWRSIAPVIGAAIRIAPEERVLAEVLVPFGRHRAGRAGRERLPITIAVKP